jgi:hypothetical protein
MSVGSSEAMRKLYGRPPTLRRDALEIDRLRHRENRVTYDDLLRYAELILADETMIARSNPRRRFIDDLTAGVAGLDCTAETTRCWTQAAPLVRQALRRAIAAASPAPFCTRPTGTRQRSLSPLLRHLSGVTGYRDARGLEAWTRIADWTAPRRHQLKRAPDATAAPGAGRDPRTRRQGHRQASRAAVVSTAV